MADDWERPLCLVENTPEMGLQVNQATLNRLHSVNKPAVVVAIVGTYRQGKSYLMNRLAGKQSGFPLGSTVQSKTKGIWVWVRPHPRKPNQCLILLDTEGLKDPEKGDANHDTWVFAIAVLLSSTFVYNSFSAVSNDAVADLHFVTEMSEHIKVKSTSGDDQSDAFGRVFPSFIWALRDFTLELKVDGRDITPDQYLDMVALKLKPGASKSTMLYNLPRECIRQYFPIRKCFCFPHPVDNRDLLKHLDSLGMEQLNADFVAVSNAFCDHVWTSAEVKTHEGRQLTGSMVGEMTHCYVKAIQDGVVPCIENAVQTTARIENTRAVQECLKFYVGQMKASVSFPTDSLDELSNLHHQVEKKAVELYLQNSIFDDEGVYQKQLAEAIQNEYSQLVKENEQASEKQSCELLERLHMVIAGRLSEGVYAVPGGYEKYKTDMAVLLQDFNKTPKKGIKAEAVLEKFMMDKKSEGAAILQADEKLKEEEKKAEEEKQKRAAAEQAQKAAEEEKQKVEKMMEDVQKSHEENVQQLKEKMEDERQRIMQENDRLLATRLKEQEDLLQKGFKDKADTMQQEIKDLRDVQLQQQQQAAAGGSGPFALLGSAFDSLLGAVSGIKNGLGAVSALAGSGKSK